RRSAVVSQLEARGGTPRPCGPSLSRRCKEDPAEDAPVLRSRDDDRVEAEAAAVTMQREDQHQHEKKEISPRPLAGSTVEAEPQIDHLQRADHAPEAHKDAEE